MMVVRGCSVARCLRVRGQRTELKFVVGDLVSSRSSRSSK